MGKKEGKIKRAKNKVAMAFKAIKLIDNWPTYLLDYFGFVKKETIIYKLRNGVRYATRPGTGDKGVMNDIWIRNTYIPEGFEIKEGDTVIDIGAHIGVFTIFASRLAKKGKVYSFEPFPSNFNMVKENIKLNDAKNVIPSNLAVSDSSSPKKLFLSNEATCHSFFKFDSQQDKTAIVKTTTLEEIIKNNDIGRVDFLKIDCEGAEYDILMKTKDDVLKNIEKISMEYHNIDENHTGELMRHFLESKGFNVVMRTDHPMIYAYRRNA